MSDLAPDGYSALSKAISSSPQCAPATMLRSTVRKSLADMPIQVPPQNMALLRSLGAAGAPLWDAIESLRGNQTPPQSCAVTGRPGRRELIIRVGLRGFWIGWEIDQTRGDHVIRVVLIEENW